MYEMIVKYLALIVKYLTLHGICRSKSLSHSDMPILGGARHSEYTNFVYLEVR